MQGESHTGRPMTYQDNGSYGRLHMCNVSLSLSLICDPSCVAGVLVQELQSACMCTAGDAAVHCDWEGTCLDRREQSGQRILPRLDQSLVPCAHLWILGILHRLHTHHRLL